MSVKRILRKIPRRWFRPGIRVVGEQINGLRRLVRSCMNALNSPVLQADHITTNQRKVSRLPAARNVLDMGMGVIFVRTTRYILLAVAFLMTVDVPRVSEAGHFWFGSKKECCQCPHCCKARKRDKKFHFEKAPILPVVSSIAAQFTDREAIERPEDDGEGDVADRPGVMTVEERVKNLEREMENLSQLVERLAKTMQKQP